MVSGRCAMLMGNTIKKVVSAMIIFFCNYEINISASQIWGAKKVMVMNLYG